MLIEIIIEDENGELVRKHKGDYYELHTVEWNEVVRDMLDVMKFEKDNVLKSK